LKKKPAVRKQVVVEETKEKPKDEKQEAHE